MRWFVLGLCLFTISVQADTYYPPAGEWPLVEASALHVDQQQLQQAIDFAIRHENPMPKDQALAQAISFGAKEPFDQIIGPMRSRAASNGLIIYQGRLIGRWGDVEKVDMAHSVSKTFLTTVTGLAVDRRLIHDVSDRVAPYVPAELELFSAPHNQPIQWLHLLQQTSDWQGTLWGKPDWADRPEGKTPADWPNRPLRTPGTYFKYNDVRVNLLALATLHVWRKPLPTVLNELIMQPIGASNSWRWYGYDNSWIELDGQRIQSVSGGGHWGGGMFINAYDLARFGYLMLKGGKWQDQQLISPEWIRMAKTPGQANRHYGFANWFLNTEQKALPSAPASAVYFEGNGRNIVYLDEANDLLIVCRWIMPGDALDQFIGKVLAALPAAANDTRHSTSRSKRK